MSSEGIVKDRYILAVEDAVALATLNEQPAVILENLTVKLARDVQPLDGRVLEKVRYTPASDLLRGWCDKPSEKAWGTDDEN